MKNSKKKQQKPQKIYDHESFMKVFREDLKESGMLDSLIETPSQPTNEYTVTLRPFARREEEKQQMKYGEKVELIYQALKKSARQIKKENKSITDVSSDDALFNIIEWYLNIKD